MIGFPLMGIVIGDVVGGGYEMAVPTTRDFALLGPNSRPSDDTILTLAVAEAVIAGRDDPGLTARLIRENLVKAVYRWPQGGYGARFLQWALSSDGAPYGSWANGAAMRVAAVTWVYESLEAVQEYAAVTAAVTHNHPEAIKGAQTVAGLVYLAGHGAGRDELQYYAEHEKGYDLSDRATDWAALCHPDALAILRYRKTRSAQYSVARSIRAFLESNDFIDAVRIAVCLGGDTDTQGSMTGAIAQAFYRKIDPNLQADALACCPSLLQQEIMRYLPRF